MAASAPPPGARFDNINLLRAFAALSVVVYHVIEVGKWTSFPTEGPLLAFRVGWLGVDLFFVISGFVITYSALLLYRADPDRFRERYWRRRLSRIVPLYLVTLFLFLAFFPPGWRAYEWVKQLVLHLTFTHSLSTSTHGGIDGPNWTIAVEMHFYLAIALGIRRLDRVAAWKILVGGVAVSWLWRIVVFYLYEGRGGNILFIRITQLPGALDEFAAGVFLAKLFLDGRRQWFAHAWIWVLAACATGFAAMQFFFSHGPYWEVPVMVILWRTSVALFFMCVVGAAVALPQWLATRALIPLAYLGETSYGIYLWHLFAINLFITSMGWRGAQALMAVLALTVALAAASWHSFEKPAMGWGRA
jgi:peptidoglycan/LPS O-acetylase OafA/YrhL